MAFDPSVSLGNLITIGSTAVGLLVYFVKSQSKVEQLEHKFDELTQTISTFRETDKELAVLRQRMGTVEEDMKTNLLAVHNQRLATLETEMGRARDNIHLMANQLQVELFARKNAESVGTARR